MAILTGIHPDHCFEALIDWSDYVGGGTSRQVFGLKDCRRAVAKSSVSPFHRANFVEWTVWNAIKQMPDHLEEVDRQNHMEMFEILQDRFGECFAISYSAKYLIMERLDDTDQKVDRLPPWLNDKKPGGVFGASDSAFGVNESHQVKVRDYGDINFYEVLSPLYQSPTAPG